MLIKPCPEKVVYMNIFIILLVVVGVTIGVGSSLGIIVTMIGTLIYKFYRKIRFGISLFN